MKEEFHAEEVRPVLDAFTQSSSTLARLLQRGVQLTDTDRLSIENNLAIVQLYYSFWVRQFGNK